MRGFTVLDLHQYYNGLKKYMYYKPSGFLHIGDAEYTPRPNSSHFVKAPMVTLMEVRV